MLHYFNPGHETAVLNSSPYYVPSGNLRKMQQDLAYLPAWYASENDFVLVKDKPTDEFIQSLCHLNTLAEGVTIENFTSQTLLIEGIEVALWGVSPHSVNMFQKLNKQYALDLSIPQWKDEYIQLCSRHTAKKCLEYLIKFIPEVSTEIIPRFHYSLEEINLTSQKHPLWLAKAPYSSSGRGLLWITNKGLTQVEKQILAGILKKQGSFSIEKGLNRQLDFAMQFFSNGSGNIEFKGFSLFKTTDKGIYKENFITSQEQMTKQISSFIDFSLVEKVKQHLIAFLEYKFAPVYRGFIGVDLMIYDENGLFRLHPCIEINMRNNMGILAMKLFQNHAAPNASGFFQIDFDAQPGAIFQKHKMMTIKYPVKYINNRINSGYLSLCPVKESSQYHAYALLDS